MSIILGIDPGSRLMGFGLIRVTGNQLAYVASGRVRMEQSGLCERLGEIFTAIRSVIQQYQPTEAAVEDVFMHRNAQSALKLGHARGAAIVAITQFQLPIAEYSPRQIKKSVVGYGAATKEQVQHMVCRLLNIKEVPYADAADALATAICHVNHAQLARISR